MGTQRVRESSGAAWVLPTGPQLTVAAVAKVSPDDILLGEAEDAQAATTHGRVQHHVAVSY